MSKESEIYRQVRMDLFKLRNKVIKTFEAEIGSLLDKYAESEIMKEKEGIIRVDDKREPILFVDDTKINGDKDKS